MDGPGCKYDTVYCTDCGGCNPSPFQNWYEYKEEEELDLNEIREKKLERIIDEK